MIYIVAGSPSKTKIFYLLTVLPVNIYTSDSAIVLIKGLNIEMYLRARK